HDLARNASRLDARAKLVADVAAARHERLFLCDTSPLGREQVQPDAMRIPVQNVTRASQLAEVVAEDTTDSERAQALLGDRKPLRRRQPRLHQRIHAEIAAAEAANSRYADLVSDRAFVRFCHVSAVAELAVG